MGVILNCIYLQAYVILGNMNMDGQPLAFSSRGPASKLTSLLGRRAGNLFTCTFSIKGI